jgi:hypothetical protein
LRSERVWSLFSLSTAVLARVVPSASIVPRRHNDTSEVGKVRDGSEIIEAVMSEIGDEMPFLSSPRRDLNEDGIRLFYKTNARGSVGHARLR